MLDNKITICGRNYDNIMEQYELNVNGLMDYYGVDDISEVAKEETLEELICNYISDYSGYCHYGYDYELDTDKKEIRVFNIAWDIDDEEDDDESESYVPVRVHCNITLDNIKQTLKVLADNGVAKDECGVVLQAIGYTLLGKELDCEGVEF